MNLTLKTFLVTINKSLFRKRHLRKWTGKINNTVEGSRSQLSKRLRNQFVNSLDKQHTEGIGNDSS